MRDAIRPAILESCRQDAEAQLASLQELFAEGACQDLPVMALAAESTAATIRKLSRMYEAGGLSDVKRASA